MKQFDQMRNLLGTDPAWVLVHSWNTSWRDRDTLHINP